MDMGTVRGLLTAILLVLFIGLVAWTWSRKRKKEYDEAAQMPLDDDDKPMTDTNRKGQSK
jgi:cytochrome c oxidase cbb3-type subunit IV